MSAKLYFLLQIIQIKAFKFFTFHEILKKNLHFTILSILFSYILFKFAMEDD